MAHLFRDLSLGNSKRETSKPTALINPTSNTILVPDLPCPFGQLDAQLSEFDLRVTAFEIFAAVCRTSAAKPLSYTHSESLNYNSPCSPISPVLQRSLTSAAASRMKKALGLRSPSSGSKKSPGSGPGKLKKPMNVAELMRTQMRVSETADSRVRRPF